MQLSADKPSMENHGLHYRTEVGLVADVKAALTALIPFLEKKTDPQFSQLAQTRMREWNALLTQVVQGFDLSPIDFAAYAKSCGAQGFRCAKFDEVHGAVHSFLSAPGPAILDAIVDADETSYARRIESVSVDTRTRTFPSAPPRKTSDGIASFAQSKFASVSSTAPVARDKSGGSF